MSNKKGEQKLEARPTFFVDFKQQIIPQFPDEEKKEYIDIKYPLIPPYAYAHIFWDEQNKELVYFVEEPVLNKAEENILQVLEDGIKELINISYIAVKSGETVIEYIEKNINILIDELQIEISKESYLKIMYFIYRDFVGLNEIEPMLNDYFIEDIECNGINSPIYIVHRKYRNLRTNIIYKDADKLALFVEKLAQKCGQYISYATPLLDGALPDGSRVNATFTEDISSKGPTFTVRKFSKNPWTPTKLMQLGTISPQMLAYLWILIEYETNVMIVGGTGSGKTTFLNALTFFIPPQARVVSIEDSVTGDSKLIIRESGHIRNINIKEFVDKKIDAEVLTLDERGKVIFVKPSKYIKHAVKKGIYEIQTSTGRKIKVTRDHSLFSLNDSGLVEVKPTDLKEGASFIAVPRLLPISGTDTSEINLIEHLSEFKEDFLVGNPIKNLFGKYNHLDIGINKQRYRWWKRYNIIKVDEFLKLEYKFSYKDLKKLRIKSKNKSSIPLIFNIDKEFLEFCGLWLGDGCYDNYNSNSVIISNVDKECRDLTKNLANRLKLSFSEMNDHGVSLRIHSTVFYKFMKNVIKLDGYSNTKKIPDFIFNLSNKQIKHFIRGYFSADGTVKKYEISCASQSLELLEDLQSMFLRLKIISRINDFYRKDMCVNLSISSSDNIKKFKEIGFLQRIKNKKLFSLNKKSHHTVSDIIPLSINKILKLNELIGNRLSWPYLQGLQNIGRTYMQKLAPINSEFNDLSHNDILWDKVVKVKKVSSDKIEVFDLSIPKYEKFLCNNVIVHNTRELNLDHENWLPSVSREGVGLVNLVGQKYGEVSLFDLLRESFRQNPDYVIVGEVRGKEAYVLFQGMASIRGDEEILVIRDNKPSKIKIQDLKDIKNVSAITYDLEKKQVNILPIRALLKHPAREALYKITTKTGREITLTPDHSLFKYQNNIVSAPMETLRIGDKILIPSRLPCAYADLDYIDLLEFLPNARVYAPILIKEAVSKVGYSQACTIAGVQSISDYYSDFARSNPSSLKVDKFLKLVKETNIDYTKEDIKIKFGKKSEMLPSKLKITPEFLRLLGYYLSEGSLNIGYKSNRISLYNKNKEILKDMEHCIIKVTSKSPTKRQTKGFGEATELSFSHKVIYEFLDKYCGKKNDKKIPDFIFGLSKEKIGNFLSALYDGDGSFTKNYFGYYTISKKFADDISKLLLVFGIVARINKRNRVGRKTTDYEILFYHSTQKNEFLKYVKSIKNKVIDIQVKQKNNKKILGDLYIDSIKSIERIKLDKKEPVYDLAVPGTRNFIGGFGGILLHNSGHPSFGTMHANSVETLIRRLETPPINLSSSLVETLDVVCVMIQTKIKGEPVRRIREISEIISVKEGFGGATINNPFIWNPQNDTFLFKSDSYVFKKLTLHHGVTREELFKELEFRAKLLVAMYKKGIFGFKEVRATVNEYYKDPKYALKKFGVI